MKINIYDEMLTINKLLELHQKTKAILIKKIDKLLNVLDTDEAKSKLHQEHINKANAKAQEILNYLNK